ncbi:MAG: hypothetical protein MUF64_33130 [Polyangiaceae bacterium]|jgi:hypothetical protein|nr:hypothetical protein [Polyangiaceae bacterium]
MLRKVVQAFELAGHQCTFDADGDAVCDKEDLSTATMVLGHIQQGSNVRLTFGTFRMPLASRNLTCKDVSDLVATAQGMLTVMSVECEQDRLAMGISIPVPENGITIREMNRVFRLVSHVATLTLAAVNSRGKEVQQGRPSAFLSR